MTTALDGSAIGSGTTQAVAATLTTTSANDVIVLLIRSSVTGGAPTVLSVADTALLTWIKRGSTVSFNGGAQKMEVWYAVSAGALTSDVITVTMNVNGGGYGTRYLALGISGGNATTPYDVNGSLPATNSSDTNVTSLAVSPATTGSAGFAYSFLTIVPGSTLGTVTYPSGFSNLVASGSTSLDYGVDIYSSALSGSRTWSWSSTSNPAGLIVDCVQQASSSGVFTPYFYHQHIGGQHV